MADDERASDLLEKDPKHMDHEEKVAAAAKLYYYNKATHGAERQQSIADELDVNSRTIRKWKDEPQFWDTIRESADDEHYSMLELANRKLKENIEEGSMRAIEHLHELTGLSEKDTRGMEQQPIQLAPPASEEESDEEDVDELSSGVLHRCTHDYCSDVRAVRDLVPE